MLDEPDQLAVMRGLRDGSRAAWTKLYDGYSVEVWRCVARLVGQRPADVADVVQEVFLAAARSARGFDPERGSLWNWLTGISHRQVALYWRQAKRAARWRELAQAGAIEIRQWLDDGAPDALLQQRELADVVRGVLAELPADYAALLAAKYLDERSLDDMAREAATSVDAIKSKLARARREFRARFEQLPRAAKVTFPP